MVAVERSATRFELWEAPRSPRLGRGARSVHTRVRFHALSTFYFIEGKLSTEYSASTLLFSIALSAYALWDWTRAGLTLSFKIEKLRTPSILVKKM